MRKFWTATLLAIFCFSTILSSAIEVSANSIQSLNEEKREIQQKKSKVDSDIKKKEEDIEQVRKEQEAVVTEINRLDEEIQVTLQKIDEKEVEIKETEKEIDILKEEIKVLKERIAVRNELLKERARSLQESGPVDYLAVILGAQNFGDLISRLGAVATFVEADQEILREHQRDKENLEAAEAEVKNKLQNLKKMREDLQSLKDSLSKQKGEKEKAKKKLEKQEIVMEEEKLELEEVNAILAAQEKAIQKAIELEKKRAEEEARRKAEEEARKKAEAERNKASTNEVKASTKSSSSSSGNSSGNKSGGSKVSAPAVSSGTWTRPAAGRLTSGFGYRSFNGGGMHYGIDIAQGGTVPVVAAADGVVIRSYYSSSYGNCVMISHSIGGQTYTTVYAHLRSRSVSSGQAVSKGQQIGYMGNTGRSFGQHLHFELHKGPWNVSKTNAVNPLNYIPM